MKWHCGHLRVILPVKDRIIRLMVLVAVLMCYVTQPVTADIVSTFNSDAEGWTLTAGGGTLTHLSSGGNPGGHLTLQDIANGPLMAYAPAVFLGDLTAYDGGLLYVDLKQIATAAGSPRGGFGQVTIEGTGGDFATADIVAGTPLSTWDTYSTSMVAATWGVTQTVWEDILSDVTEIRMEVDSYVEFEDTIGFDNFGIHPIPEPASLAIAVSGLYLAVWRRQRRDKK